MGSPVSHVFKQGPVLKALAKVALSGGKKGAGVQCPGPVISAELPPRDAQLLQDYIRHVGGNPSAYGDALPPHLFPQWGFPLLARAIADAPYTLSKVLNGGARIEINAPLPNNAPLLCTAQLVEIDDNGQRAILRQRLCTGTADEPGAVRGRETKKRAPHDSRRCEGTGAVETS
jgi:hypothetical protein